MRPIILLPFLTVALVGCTNNLVGGVDQIFGRTKVAPPATGSAAAADPAYTTRGLASNAAPPAATTAPSTSPAYSSIPAVAKAPEAPIVRTETAAAVPSYNSSVPLNVAPSVTISPVSPINPINTSNPSPVSVSSTTTFNTSGNTYVVAGGGSSTASAGARPLTDAFTSSSGSGPLDSNPYGPGPKMTRTRVAPMSLADNRARTYGQLGQVTVDQNAAPLQTNAATSGAAATPGYGTTRSGTWAAPNSSGQNQSGNVIDIMDLPPKGSGGTSGAGSNYQRSGGTFGASTTIHRDPAVQQAAATMVETSSGMQTANPYSKNSPESNKPITSDIASKYACAGNHSWLKGRLEYSQARRRWKLRYIPLDGEADRFGGSVVLQNTSLISGCKPGDFVEVNGRIVGESKTPGDFAPDYEISQIKSR